MSGWVAADAAAAMQWTVSRAGQEWLAGVSETLRRQKEETERAVAAARRAREVAMEKWHSLLKQYAVYYGDFM
jgi:hypothetical protein